MAGRPGLPTYLLPKPSVPILAQLTPQKWKDWACVPEVPPALRLSFHDSRLVQGLLVIKQRSLGQLRWCWEMAL